MPINNIKNLEGIYMKINDLATSKTTIKQEREIQREGLKNEEKVSQGEKSVPRDRVEISHTKIISSALKKSETLPQVREDKVSQLKQAIAEGKYQISNKDLAQAMIRSLLSEIA